MRKLIATLVTGLVVALALPAVAQRTQMVNANGDTVGGTNFNVTGKLSARASFWLWFANGETNYLRSTNFPGTVGYVLTLGPNGVYAGPVAASSAGVTNITLAVPSQFGTNNDGTVQTAGTLGFSNVFQTANTVLAGPTSGSKAEPAYRALVNADIPTALSIASENVSGAFTANSVGATNGIYDFAGLTVTGAGGFGGALMASNTLTSVGVFQAQAGANITAGLNANSLNSTSTISGQAGLNLAGTANVNSLNSTSTIAGQAGGNIAGALTADNATITNGTTLKGAFQAQSTAKITSETDIGGPVIITNIVQANNLVITNNGSLAFATNSTNPDTFLVRDNAPNVLAQRNGTSAQTNRLYGSYTDSGNNEYLEFRSSTAANYILSGKLGSGSLRQIYMQGVGGAASLSLGGTSGSLNVDASGNMIAGSDAIYNIGATNATRWKTLFLARGLVIGPNSGGGFLTNILTARAILDFPSTAAQSSSDLSITVTGATTNDVATVGVPPVAHLPNTSFTCFSSNDTVWVRFNNYSSGALDPGPVSVSTLVNRF